MGWVGPFEENKLGDVDHLVVPPCVVWNRTNIVRLPVGVHIVRQVSSTESIVATAFRITVVEITVAGEVQSFPLPPVVVPVLVNTFGYLIIQTGHIHGVDLTDVVEININTVHFHVWQHQGYGIGNRI